MRGRLIAREGDQGIVRTEREDIRVDGLSRSDRIGQFMDTGELSPHVPAQPYPGPGSEVMRLTRDRMTKLRERARVLSTVRAFFAERDFLEVETPLLVPSPGLEIHLDAVEAGDGFLITSPEYSMKRLLAAGFEKIYQVCKCFRANERGPHHASEFTMIEWYRAYDGIATIARDTEQLVHAVCGDHVRLGDRSIDVVPPWARMTVRDAMLFWADVRVAGDESAVELTAAVRAAGIEVTDGLAWDDVFFTAWLARVEPVLAKLDHAILIEDWPAPLAALARRKDDDRRVALRFEAYVGGLELANAFDELVDANEQEARFRDEQVARFQRARPVYPVDDKLVAALREGLPPSGGIALGFDRLVMLATGATTIDQVQAFADHER
jgi:elongation factor P--(R)-beta-lysine ligase